MTILSAADAAVFETFVAPKYLSYFAELALGAMLEADGAKIAHLGCRTGFPDAALAERFPLGFIVGTDPSAAAIDLARAKAVTVHGARLEYEVSELPTSFPARSFSHALCIHPFAPRADDRGRLFAECARLIASSGQVVVALPLRGSFQELYDLAREYALKYDANDVGRAMESSILHRPNIESLSQELAAVGFEDVDVELHRALVPFDGGRDLLEDPAVRLLVLPELAHQADEHVDLERALRYVRDAVDRYWAEEHFELTLNIGVATGRIY